MPNGKGKTARRRYRSETATSKVERVLRAANDYVTPEELAARTQEPMNRVTAALWKMQYYNVADFVTGKNGKRTHWFALPPEQDTRHDVRPLRVEEAPGTRKARKARVLKPR